MPNYSKDDILRIVSEKNVQFIRLQFTDILGQLKNVTIMPSQLGKVLEDGCMFDGSSIEGFVRIEESDQILVPDINTFCILPWEDENGRVARIICDIYNADGQHFSGDPRYRLKKAIEDAAAMGFSFEVGPECEFFLFQTDSNGNPTAQTQDQAAYFDLGPVDYGEVVRRQICLNLGQMGFEIETSHHESAPGQHEIDFRYDNALATADNIMTFKMAVKTIAKRNGLHATFMPKPVYGIAGSGMHLNMSLSRDGRNIFYDEKDSYHLSSEAYAFIAGIMSHIKGMTAVTNPLVNSYKRLVAGYEAPCYIAWSARNRSPLVRIPTVSGRGGARIELRSADPSANPYLALAVCLEAGLDGIRRGLTPPAPVDCNIYEMDEAGLAENGIDRLPDSLYNAITAMHNDQLVCDTLGGHILGRYTDAKMKDWQEYCTRITDWEIGRYFVNY